MVYWLFFPLENSGNKISNSNLALTFCRGYSQCILNPADMAYFYYRLISQLENLIKLISGLVWIRIPSCLRQILKLSLSHKLSRFMKKIRLI